MVSLRYDLNADALYLRLLDAEHTVPVDHTDELDHGTFVDLGPNDELIGVEVIRPGRDWPLTELLARYELAPNAALLLRALFPSASSGDNVGDRPVAYEAMEHQFSGAGLALAG